MRNDQCSTIMHIALIIVLWHNWTDYRVQTVNDLSPQHGMKSNLLMVFHCGCTVAQ